MANESTSQRNWTIMVYLAGDNNLDSAGVVDLLEMKTIGTTDQFAVLAQFDRAGAGLATIRYCLRKDTPLDQDAVETLGETNMGDPKVLEDFVTWGITQYPADHYLLVLWNHGAGWDDANLYQGGVFSGAAPPVARKGQPVAIRGGGAGKGKPVSLAQARSGIRNTRRALFRSTVEAAVLDRAIAFDDQAQDFLDNIELKKVMARIKKKLTRKIDILGMDACLMSMAEVAYQIRGVARFCVGSQETEPGDGWPYDRILKALAAKPTMAPRALSKTIVNQYVASYRPYDNITQSALKLAELKPLTAAVDGLANALKNLLADTASRNALIGVRAQVQEYSRPYDDYCDLLDLCSLLETRLPDAGVLTACAALKEAGAAAIIANGYKGSAVDHSLGISIYFPKRTLSPLYKTLDFTKESGWDEFLAAYLAALRQ